MSIHINQKFLDFLKDKDKVEFEATRVGFGKALLDLGKDNQNIIAICADLTESMQMDKFKNNFPDRFIEVGIAEQNMASLASGMSAMGAIPFIGSYAMFSPGRNWEQIRTNICYNDQKVIIVGGHAGLSVGPDGGTHQALEDIAIMRVLPNMTIFYPSDSIEAYQMTKLAAHIEGPVYIRLCREKTPIILDHDLSFKNSTEDQILQDIINLKNIHVYNNNKHDGKTLSIITTGPILYQVIKACEKLDMLYPSLPVNINVYNLNILKFADNILQDKLETKIINILKSSHNVLTVEEHQIAGGLGSIISEISTEHMPKHIKRIGVKNRFGQSGNMEELYKEYGVDYEHIIQYILDMAHK
jgi:transketolase